MSAVLVKNAERMMTSAEPMKEGIEITFADGCRGLVPFEKISEIETGENLVSVELPNKRKISCCSCSVNRGMVYRTFAA